MQTQQVKRVLGLITGEIVFGNMQSVDTEAGKEILIIQPYQAKDGNIMPFRIHDLANGPGAIQLHPMNIIWSSPLEDFPEIQTAYLKATTNIEAPSKPKIIL